jgi:DNA modification methylase
MVLVATERTKTTTAARPIFPRDFVNQIICGDAVSVMRKMPTGAIDLVITSPPYSHR